MRWDSKIKKGHACNPLTVIMEGICQCTSGYTGWPQAVQLGNSTEITILTHNKNNKHTHTHTHIKQTTDTSTYGQKHKCLKPKCSSEVKFLLRLHVFLSAGAYNPGHPNNHTWITHTLTHTRARTHMHTKPSPGYEWQQWPSVPAAVRWSSRCRW